MVVSVSPSPRLSDSLEWEEEPEVLNTDPRFSLQALSLETGYSDLDDRQDERLFAGTPDPTARRRRRRLRESNSLFANAPPFAYKTTADGNAFRLVLVHPGTGANPVVCQMLWEDSRKPETDYCCLSYAWESTVREEFILLDGYTFPITKNLLSALKHLRKPSQTFLIWVDQICINQQDDKERGHQVGIMKHIFNRSNKIYVWLGEADHRSKWLSEYARGMRRGEPNRVSNRLLNQKKVRDAIQSLLERPWFQRVWVIPEVVLSKHTIVAWTIQASGRLRISWDHLLKLIRDTQLPMISGFDKQTSLLGNPRQRIAIISQMISSQKEAISHTDITQLLILGKGSAATDVRDFVYAFYALTYLTTSVDYRLSAEFLFVEVIHMYINSIQWESSYASQHCLTDGQKDRQLMSILYSAGKLHQHYDLPTWIPDWTFSWHLAPIWVKPAPNFSTISSKDEWSNGIRTDYRAGGDHKETFEILQGSRGQLRVSAFVFDTVLLVNEITPASTPSGSQELGRSPGQGWDGSDLPIIRYGRHFFSTRNGHVGLATPGIQAGDEIAIVLGGDVPIVVRACPDPERKEKIYQLLCECYIQSTHIMNGDLLRENWTSAEDIVFV